MSTIARFVTAAAAVAAISSAVVPAHAVQLTTTGGQNPAWSSSGDWIAYEYNGDLFWVASDGSGTATQLTTDPALDFAPVWVPGENAVIFASGRLGTDSIHRITVPGGVVTPVVVSPFTNRFPAVSPDGRKVAYSSDRGGDFDIWVRDLDAGTDTQLTFDADQEDDLAWSPDGAWIAYRLGVSGSSISAVPAAGGAVITLADSPGAEAHPTWNWDSQSIAFGSYATGQWNIYLVGLGGGSPIPLLDDPTISQSMPAYSPHGDRLAYTSNETGPFEIFTLDGILDAPSSGDARPIIALRNAPNPFRSGTRLFASFEDGERVSSDLTFRIFDAQGRQVRELQGVRTGATVEASWDGHGASGAPLPNGVYFYRLSVDGRTTDAGRATLRR